MQNLNNGKCCVEFCQNNNNFRSCITTFAALIVVALYQKHLYYVLPLIAVVGCGGDNDFSYISKYLLDVKMALKNY